MSEKEYVLVTPARNEAAFIGKTIEAVISQTRLPKRWIIVSDGSTDQTDEIVKNYATKHRFIQLVRSSQCCVRSFSSKVGAFEAGYKKLKSTRYDFLGNLDADVSFDASYYERVLQEFERDSKLGLAGGLIQELANGRFKAQRMSLNSVAGAIQLFRRECFEEIGGYVPMDVGGIDAAAEITARKHQWKVRTFSEIKVFHHRRVSNGFKSIFLTRFLQGTGHYVLGYHPLFQVARCFYRIADRPYLVGAGLMLAGYFWAWVRGYERPLAQDVVRYVRAEQLDRLKKLLRVGTRRKERAVH